MANLRRFVIIVVLSVLTLSVSAQRPAYYKMSRLVRNACREAGSPSFVKRAAGNRPSSIIAFVKLTDGDYDALANRGCKVLLRYGNLCVADIPLQSIGELSLDKSISRIEAGRSATAMMDTTAIVINAVPVHEGIDLPQGYTGKNVVVGVQDIGFDLTNPNFWNADMTQYRIKAMWDQLSDDTIGSRFPVGRDYVGQEALLEVQHPRDGLIQTHGTHTTGIAAGSGGEGGGVVSPYKGIAYDADIVLVCNATSDDASLISPSDYYKYTYAVDALGFKYIFDYADSVGKPCVINFSEGSGMDFRGDDQLYYEMLDSLTGPGHIIVASAGNAGNRINYFAKDAMQKSASINCTPGRNVTVTTRSKDNFTFRFQRKNDNDVLSVNIPLSKVLSAEDSTYTDSIFGNGIKNYITATAYRSCYDPSDIICDWQITRAQDSSSQDGEWSLLFTLSGDGLVELFPESASIYHDDGTVHDGDNIYSINSPGSAPSVICVGMTGYRTHIKNYLGDWIQPGATDVANGERNVNSSVGPTFDERIKPDVMAPGQNIISSYSCFCERYHRATSNVRIFNYNGREYVWNADMGTSMSAPVVTGVIALWLQACPTLTPSDCIDIFSKTCKHFDESLSYPNNYYGYGEIDAEAGMKLVLQKVAAGIKEIPANMQDDTRIYTIDGRYAGTDLSRLHRGLYIRNGKKIVVND